MRNLKSFLHFLKVKWLINQATDTKETVGKSPSVENCEYFSLDVSTAEISYILIINYLYHTNFDITQNI